MAALELDEEFVKQCGRVAFSAYSEIEALRNTSNELVKAYGGRPKDSQRSPTVFETDHEVQIAVWELRDEKGSYCAIGIRGTDTLQNGLQDLKCKQINLDSSDCSIFNSASESPPPKVHQGFREAFLAMRSQISDTLKSNFSDVCSRIVVAGHSLGGALAVLVGLDLALNFSHEKSKISVVTFGKPHVGDCAFRDFFCKRFKGHLVVHFCSSADPIPKICKVASAAGAGKYEHECDLHVLDCLADQALEALPLVASAASSLKTDKSMLKACGNETKILVAKFHSCAYYWEQIQVFKKPDRRSFRRLEKAVVAGHKTTQMLSQAMHKPDSSNSGSSSSSLVLRKLFELVQELPKQRGVHPRAMLAVGAGLAVVGMCSAAWVTMRGSQERRNVEEALDRLKDGQQQLHVGVREIQNSVTRLHSEVQGLREGQDRIEKLIGDLNNNLKIALEETKLMKIKSHCQMMLDNLVSEDARRIQEEEAEILKNASHDKATLKTALLQIWEQACAEREYILDSETRTRIEMLCLLLVQTIQLEWSYRSFLFSNKDPEEITEELHRHIRFCVQTYGPTLGKMAWICTEHNSKTSIAQAALAATAQRFRAACGCDLISQSSDEIDVVLASKKLEARSDWKRQDFKFTTDEWYSILALDTENSEAKLVLVGSAFQSQELPGVARHHFELALKRASHGFKAEVRTRLATMDGLIALSLEDEMLAACGAEDRAAIRRAMFDLVDVLWDADRLADFLVALCRLVEDHHSDHEVFPFLQIPPDVWEHLSQRIHACSWEKSVLAGGRQLLQRLVSGQDPEGRADRDCSPATKGNTLLAWDSLARQSRLFQEQQHDNAVDKACMRAIKQLQAKLVDDAVSYRMTYHRETQHIVVAFASKGIQNHFDVGPEDKASGPQNTIASLCLLQEGRGPEVNAHVWSMLKKSVNLTEFTSKLKAECSRLDTNNFVVTGHGISGACGMLAMTYLLVSKLEEVEGLAGSVVTFGAPNVLGDISNYPNLQFLKDKTRCYVRASDYAPMLFGDWGERNQQWRRFWQGQARMVQDDVKSQQLQLQTALNERLREGKERAENLERQIGLLQQKASAHLGRANTRRGVMAAAGGVALIAATGGLATGVAIAAGGAAAYQTKKAEDNVEKLQQTIDQQKQNVIAAKRDVSKYQQQLSTVAPSSKQKVALICHHACEACTIQGVGRRYSAVGRFRFLGRDVPEEEEEDEGEEGGEEEEKEEEAQGGQEEEPGSETNALRGRLLAGFESVRSDADLCDLKGNAKATHIRDRLLWDHELAQYDKGLAEWTSAFPQTALEGVRADIARCLSQVSRDASSLADPTVGVSRSSARKPESASVEPEPKSGRAAEGSENAPGQGTDQTDVDGGAQATSEHGRDPSRPREAEDEAADLDDVEIERWVLLSDQAEEHQRDPHDASASDGRTTTAGR